MNGDKKEEPTPTQTESQPQQPIANHEEKKPINENNKIGSLYGTQSMYVKLVSSDMHEFIIQRSHAELAPTIKAMLDGPGKRLSNILERLYFHFISLGIYEETDECIVSFREIP